MKYLNERLLLEEDGFEDIEAEESEVSQETPENDTEPSLDDEMTSNTNSEENTPTEEPVEDTGDTEPTTTLYKVTFTLGKHDNWSRVDASSEQEAEEIVRDYVTKKWPDREFEIVSTEEFEEVEESLNESLGEVTDAQPIETGPAVGMATVISDLIKDEYEAIDGYNSAIATAEAEGFEDMVKVLTEIQAEENLHIGQLQTLMNTIDPNAHLVDDGRQEGIEQLSGDLSMDNPMTEDLDDMSLQDQRMFIRCVNEIWNMSVMEWTQKYYAGQLEVVTVDSYDSIPDTSNLIEIGSSDISQGTGNVIVYTYMDAGDGTLYRYADY